MLANESAILAFEGLVFTIKRFFHALFQKALGIAHEKRVPIGAPDHFYNVPAGTAELSFKFLDNFAVAAYWAIEALQIAVDHKDQVIQVFATGQAQRAHRFWFVHLAVAHESPHLAI